MKKQFTCIVCPNGCEIEAEVENGQVISVTGHTCPRGEQYVRQELTAPRRTIASSVLVKGGELPVTSVRLTKAIPKDMIFPVMDEIRQGGADRPPSRRAPSCCTTSAGWTVT